MSSDYYTLEDLLKKNDSMLTVELVNSALLYEGVLRVVEYEESPGNWSTFLELTNKDGDELGDNFETSHPIRTIPMYWADVFDQIQELTGDFITNGQPKKRPRKRTVGKKPKEPDLAPAGLFGKDGQDNIAHCRDASVQSNSSKSSGLGGRYDDTEKKFQAFVFCSIALVVIYFWLSSFLESNGHFSKADEQYEAFCSAIESTRDEYGVIYDGPNYIDKESDLNSLVKQRADSIAKTLPDSTFTDWPVELIELRMSSGNDELFVDLQLGCEAEIGAYIDSGSDIFKAFKPFKEDEYVFVSGAFIVDNEEHFFSESSVTQSGAMKLPEYRAVISDVKRSLH